MDVIHDLLRPVMAHASVMHSICPAILFVILLSVVFIVSPFPVELWRGCSTKVLPNNSETLIFGKFDETQLKQTNMVEFIDFLAF